MQINSVLINWYNKNKRDLPWRKTKNPYFIWLSEIILQQTRIEQGLSYYIRFAEKYPDIQSLAAARQDEILKMWQGLGYYSRARNMHVAANQVMNDFDGKFPSDYHSIRLLKGVGDYTAAAIASFAFNLKHPVVDGNVFRFLSRYFGIKTPIDTLKGKKEFFQLAEEILADAPPSVFNQAIMEFGSRQCRPVNPSCENCPLSTSCFAFEKKSVTAFPVKKNTTKTKNRFFNYLVINQKDSIYIKKRNDKDIWMGLFDFPLIESVKRMTEESVFTTLEWKKTFGRKKPKLVSISREYKHVLSHQLIYARFYEVTVDQMNDPSVEWKKIQKKFIDKFAVPKLIENYLDDYFSKTE
jgi:A/G-specific adenine glycosylase